MNRILQVKYTCIIEHYRAQSQNAGKFLNYLLETKFVCSYKTAEI